MYACDLALIYESAVTETMHTLRGRPKVKSDMTMHQKSVGLYYFIMVNNSLGSVNCHSYITFSLSHLHSLCLGASLV